MRETLKKRQENVCKKPVRRNFVFYQKWSSCVHVKVWWPRSPSQLPVLFNCIYERPWGFVYCFEWKEITQIWIWIQENKNLKNHIAQLWACIKAKFWTFTDWISTAKFLFARNLCSMPDRTSVYWLLEMSNAFRVTIGTRSIDNEKISAQMSRIIEHKCYASLHLVTFKNFK